MNGTSERLREISRDVAIALASVGTKHGVSFKTGGVSYTDLYFTFSTKGRFLDATGSTEEADKAEWDAYCGKFGLTKEMFGKMTIVAGKTYKIVAIAPKGRKYSVIGQLGSGGKYKLTADAVRTGLGIKSAEKMVITKHDVGSIEEVLKDVI